MSVITKVTIDGRDIAGTVLPETVAGKPFVCVEAKGKAVDKLAAAHLFGPGRKNPKTAVLPVGVYALPSPLPVGGYELVVRRQGESDTDALRVKFGVVAAQTPSLPETKPTPVEQPKLTGRLKRGLSDLAHKTYADTKALVDPLKLASLRVWFGTQDFANYKRDSEVAVALGYEAAGLSTIYCFAQDGMTPAKAKNAPAWMVKAVADLVAVYDANPATKGRTVRVEFGNEPDLKNSNVGQYWQGTIDEYANTLAAVYAVLKERFGNRVQVIAAGFSWDIDALEEVGPTLKCDALAFHGYPPEIDDTSMKRYVRFSDLCLSLGKPGIITEGSPGFGKAVKAGTKKLSQWAKAWQTYLLRLEALPGITEVILFNAFDIGTTNSAGAVFTRDLKPTESYEAVKAIVP